MPSAKEGTMAQTVLNGRQRAELLDLSRSVGGLLVSDVMAKHGISRRSVYYDVERIDEWLSERGIGHVRVSSQVIDAEDVAWNRIEKVYGEHFTPKVSAEERKALGACRIALSTNVMTISSLMQQFGVSRNTIIGDIRDLKAELVPLGLELCSSTTDGYSIAGDELTIRKFIWSKMQSLAGTGRIDDIKRYLQASLTRATGNDIDYFELCRSLIKQYETDLKTRCFLNSAGLEGMMIQVSWLRGIAGHWVEMGREEQLTLMGTVSYRSVEMSAEKLKKVGIILPPEEILYITSLLLGIKTADFAVHSEEDEYVSGLAERLITNFERVGCLTFANKGYVHEQLMHHIRPLYYRQKYGITVHNPLTTDIQQMYPMTYEFTRRAAVLSGMGQLAEDEMAYLTVYLSADLDNKMLEQGDTSATKVLLVGATNMSVATLVREQLKDVVGIQFDFDFAEPEKLKRWTFEGYALVLTLVQLPKGMYSDNMVEITPFLSEESCQRIYGILRNNRIISRYDTLIEGIAEIVGRSLPERDQEALRSDKLHFELFHFFDERDRGLMGPPVAQAQNSCVLQRKVYLSSGSTWEEAVIAGASELQDGVATSRLVERMENIIRGRRLLYYRAESDVVVVRCPMQGDEGARVAAQMVISRDGVIFPDGEPANVVICIATINRYSHWGTLYSLYEWLSVPEHVSGLIREANEKDYQDNGGDSR